VKTKKRHLADSFVVNLPTKMPRRCPKCNAQWPRRLAVVDEDLICDGCHDPTPCQFREEEE